MKQVLFESKKALEEAVPESKICQIMINSQRYLMFRSQSGIYMFDAVCPHMGHPLKDGLLNAYNEIICPLHHFRFNLKFGDEYYNRCKPLKLYKPEWNSDGELIVNL